MTGSLASLLGLLAPAGCWGCGRESAVGGLCGDCRSGCRWLSETVLLGDGRTWLWAPQAYEGPAAALVRALKFRGATGLATPMAAQMAANAPPGLLDGEPTLVPVPLHPSRRRRRGYNQAALLAEALAGRRSLAVGHLLRRTGRPTRQVGRDRAARLAGMRDAIEPLAGARPACRAVIVDDVATTGATLTAAAAALRRAGSVEVGAIVFARTPGR